MNNKLEGEKLSRPVESVREHYFGTQHLTVIEPASGWRALDLKELWAYRELFWVLTARDVKVRYKQTVLGFAWAIIQPVMTMVVFSIISGASPRCRQTASLTRSLYIRVFCPGPSLPMPLVVRALPSSARPI